MRKNDQKTLKNFLDNIYPKYYSIETLTEIKPMMNYKFHEDRVVVHILLPGREKSDIKIMKEDSKTLIIKAPEITFEEDSEINFELPEVDSSFILNKGHIKDVDATYENGILKLVMKTQDFKDDSDSIEIK